MYLHDTTRGPVFIMLSQFIPLRLKIPVHIIPARWIYCRMYVHCHNSYSYVKYPTENKRNVRTGGTPIGSRDFLFFSSFFFLVIYLWAQPISMARRRKIGDIDAWAAVWSTVGEMKTTRFLTHISMIVARRSEHPLVSCKTRIGHTNSFFFWSTTING